ncbi:MAG: DUF459 domain-containing protein [Deltaproteobacteria bacterium]|jgi:S-formylglutathione hydrolase FrmB/lysophospholipase L1-like esterase|nr:DUF459 domain-containing protein [Deltaproteobacteria bacterium]
MKQNRQGLRPAQLVVIYALAAILIVINQADGVAGWLEDIGRSGQSPVHAWFMDLADDVRSVSDRSGLSTISRGESKILDAMTPKWEIGNLAKDQIQELAPAQPSLDPATSKAPAPSLALPPATSPAPFQASSPSHFSPAPINQEILTESNASGPDGLLVASARPVSIYDTDLQALAIPLMPGSPQADPNWVRPGFTSDEPIRKVLLTGDSMMIEGVGPPLERYFKAIEGVEVTRKGQYSTGLCRLDYFDWFGFMAQILAEKNPDLVIITLGANDTQDIVLENRKRLMVASDGWNEAYAERVGKLIALVNEAGARLLWLGLPIMGREPYNARVQNINRVTKEVCDRAENCLFWDASFSLTDKNGKYGSFMTVKDGRHVKVRAKDSIHLTDEGGKQMLSDLLDQSPYLAAQYLENPAALTFEPPAAGQNPADAPSPDELLAPGLADLAPSEIVLTVNAVTSGGNAAPGSWPPELAQANQSASPEASQTAASQTAENQAAASQAAASQAALAAAESSVRFTDYVPGQAPSRDQTPFGPFKLAETQIGRAGRAKSSYLAAVPSKAPREKLPAILLLHGAEGDHKYYSKGLGRSLLEMASRYGVIFIMPDGDPFGWYLDSPLKDDSQLATHVMEEVLPDALDRHPIDPNRLAISGISMGGHGALTLALNNPGRFKAISLLSAVIDLESHKSNSSLDRYLRLAEVLGPPELARNVWRDHSAYFLTRTKAQSLENVPMMISIGTSDKLCLAENRQYDRLLTDLGLKHYYLERSGGHGWDFWKAAFPTHLAFLTENL